MPRYCVREIETDTSMAQEIGGVGDTIFKVFYFASRDPGMEIQSIIDEVYMKENKQTIKLRRKNNTFTLI